MNRVILIGRLTRDPEIRYAQNNNMAIARYTLAVDRQGRRNQGMDGAQDTADFIRCVAFDRTAEFAERYLHQGTKIAVEGRIQTGSYTNKDGQKVYTTDVIVDRHEFVESKNAASNYQGNGYAGSGYQGGGGYQNNNAYQGRGYQNDDLSSNAGNAANDDFGSSIGDGFMNIPDGVEDEGLPFN